MVLEKPDLRAKRYYLLPIKLCILVSVFGELSIFILFGVILYPEGSWLIKFLWTVIFCGLGMGSTLGAFIAFFIESKLTGLKAILATAVLSTLLLGFLCDFLCYRLDTVFHYFGGHESPALFISNGILLSLLGGILVGWLLFTNKGNKLLEKSGL